jgi:tetratricopeptide (TPR) repeat protein
MIVTARVQPTPEIPAPPLLDRAIIALNALGFYVLKLIWPASLGIDYGQRPDVLVHRALLWVAVIAASAIGFAVGFTRSRWLAGAGLVFAIALLPTLGLTPFVFQWLSTVADRYAYLALLGPAIALAMLASEIRRPAVAWACAIVLLALAGRSFVQAGVWRDGVTLMRHALTINLDSPVAHNQIGDALFRAGDIPGAQTHFAHAVRVCPDYLIARDNLAVTLMRQGRNAEALELMRRTLAMKQALPPAIAQPTDEDLERIAAVERALAATTTKPARR